MQDFYVIEFYSVALVLLYSYAEVKHLYIYCNTSAAPEISLSQSSDLSATWSSLISASSFCRCNTNHHFITSAWLCIAPASSPWSALLSNKPPEINFHAFRLRRRLNQVETYLWWLWVKVAITQTTQWASRRSIKTIMLLWQLLLIDWCTVTNWWLPCCVLTWIISHGRRKKKCFHMLHITLTEPDHVAWKSTFKGGC